MTRSGEEIQTALRGFVARWRDYAGTERAEAQTFLNELFACYGTDRQAVGARFEDFSALAGFMDLHWPGVCIVEMKAPTRDVKVGRDQVARYRAESSDPAQEIPAARWVVICSFRRFEVWDAAFFPSQPRFEFALHELPDRYDALAFLAGPQLEPSFVEHHRELTKDGAKQIAKMYQAMVDRDAAPADEIQQFVMQAVWCLFAEDLGMLEGYPLQKAVGRLLAQPGRSSAQEIGYLSVCSTRRVTTTAAASGPARGTSTASCSPVPRRSILTSMSSGCSRQPRSSTGERSTRRSSAR